MQGHLTLLQQYVSTALPKQPVQRKPSLPKCHSGSSVDSGASPVTGGASVGQSTDNVSNASGPRDSDDERELPNDIDLTAKPEKDSRCNIS